MLVYIIDGFNVIHKIPELKTSLSPQKDLIAYIKRKRLTGSKNNRVVVVFDGKPDLTLGEKDFEVFFSQDRTADDVIKEKVSRMKNKRQVLVVTDDREIVSRVKNEGAAVLRVSDFIKTKPKKCKDEGKDISYKLQHQITEELRRIWLE